MKYVYHVHDKRRTYILLPIVEICSIVGSWCAWFTVKKKKSIDNSEVNPSTTGLKYFNSFMAFHESNNC
jgi:hypothetical protein